LQVRLLQGAIPRPFIHIARTAIKITFIPEVENLKTFAIKFLAP